MAESYGKKAEHKVRLWLDRPDLGYSFDRIPDQTSGFYGSTNICDFTCFKSPYMFYIESKETEHDRFDFSMLSDCQYAGLLKKSKIQNCFGLVVVLFASHKRAFILNIQDIDASIKAGKKSINVTKIDKWKIPYAEIPTVPSRKLMLDYTGDLLELLKLNK